MPRTVIRRWLRTLRSPQQAGWAGESSAGARRPSACLSLTSGKPGPAPARAAGAGAGLGRHRTSPSGACGAGKVAHALGGARPVCAFSLYSPLLQGPQEPQQPCLLFSFSALYRAGSWQATAGGGSGSTQQGRAARGPNREPRAGKLQVNQAQPLRDGWAHPRAGHAGTDPRLQNGHEVAQCRTGPDGTAQTLHTPWPWKPGAVGTCVWPEHSWSAAPPQDSSKTPSPSSSHAKCPGHAPQSRGACRTRRTPCLVTERSDPHTSYPSQINSKQTPGTYFFKPTKLTSFCML